MQSISTSTTKLRALQDIAELQCKIIRRPLLQKNSGGILAEFWLLSVSTEYNVPAKF